MNTNEAASRLAPRLAATNLRHDLAILLRSHVPLVLVETREEKRALNLLLDAARNITRQPVRPIFQWTVTEGLRRLDIDMGGAQRHNAEAGEVLKSIRATTTPGIYALLDFHPFLHDPVHVRMLKDICQDYGRCPRMLVLISHEVTLPRELEHFAARFHIAVPDRNERQLIIEAVASEWTQRHGGRVKVDHTAMELLIANLGGLSRSDAERLARQAIFDDGALLSCDLPGVMAAKHSLINSHGVMSFEHDTLRFADLGGMGRLKQWLEQRRVAFSGQAPQLPAPKGLLLLGVQGCGKSIAARAAAGIYGVPLLRMDFAALHNKFVGESERNLRETLAAADAMAPCVLWIDEIEKGIATGEGDSGTSRRVLGTFLTWLAEKTSQVFVVATANDISALPPELIRKGRFDEIFFVDLPRDEVRAQILKIHAARRSVPLGATQIERLVAASAGFSGAELEQAVVAAAYRAHASNSATNADHILHEIHSTQPLSVVMTEQIASLREWAAQRTVPAD